MLQAAGTIHIPERFSYQVFDLSVIFFSFQTNGNVIFVFMPGVARPSFQSAGSYPAQTIMNAFL
jgi:hypothetical protein